MVEDKHPIFLQLTAGRGPAECALAVSKLVAYLIRKGRETGLNIELVQAESGSAKNTYQSAVLSITGEGRKAFIVPFLGTVKWICESPYRPTHKRKNWFVGVNLLLGSQIKRENVKLSDVRWKAVRASGPGGQHVNTTDSAVQAEHLPTGIRVIAREHKSQHANRKHAMAKIEALILLKEEESKQRDAQNEWQNHTALQRGRSVKTFKGTNFSEL